MRALGASRTSVVPGGVLAGPWVRNELWRRARAVPSVDLRFADDKSLTDAVTGQNLITFTRASGGTFVDSAGVIQTATTDVPRFDHNPTTGESLGLLVEESRTNLFQYSEEFDNAYWAKTNAAGTVTANQAVAPDGATTADLYKEDTTTVGRYLSRSISFTSGTTYSVSCWAKQAPGATRYLGLIFPNTAFGASVGASFTLSGAGSFNISVSGTNTSAQIQAFPNGWYRCTLISQATVTAAGGVQIRLSSSASSAANSWTGDGTSGLYIWGAQLEAGAFATSYIPTTSATVTRSADVASITGANFSSWYRQDEGTVFTQTQLQRQNATTSAAMCGIETGVNFAEAIYMHYRATGASAFTMYDNSTLQADFSPYGSAISAGTIASQAGAYKLNDSVGIGGGVAQTTDTVCTVPTPDRLLIGFSSAASNYLSGTIRRLTYWPSRLPNNVLQQITL